MEKETCIKLFQEISKLFGVEEDANQKGWQLNYQQFQNEFIESPNPATILIGAKWVRGQCGTGRFPKIEKLREGLRVAIKMEMEEEERRRANEPKFDPNKSITLYKTVCMSVEAFRAIPPDMVREIICKGANKVQAVLNEVEYRAKDLADAARFMKKKIGNGNNDHASNAILEGINKPSEPQPVTPNSNDELQQFNRMLDNVKDEREGAAI